MMTREENIRAIIECHFAGLEDEMIDSACERICELEIAPCDDAISREDAITAISQAFSWVVPSHPSKEVREILNKCKENLRELPSVTHKSGKWEDLHRCWVCSECGQQTHIEHKYCPNCGAKMESEE